MAEEHTISAKLELIECKAEMEDLRRQQIAQQAQLHATRLEVKREVQLAEQSLEASEALLMA